LLQLETYDTEKSFVSRQISDLCGAKHIESDRMPKQDIADGEPTYSAEESKATYDTDYLNEQSRFNGFDCVWKVDSSNRERVLSS